MDNWDVDNSKMTKKVLSVIKDIISEEDNVDISWLIKIFNESEDLYEAETVYATLNLDTILSAPFKCKYKIKETDELKISILEFIYNGLFEHFLRKIIEKNEGSICSGDKIGFIIKMVKQSLIQGENLSLYQTYKDSPSRAYWSPLSFSDTNDAINKFFEWYKVV